MPAPTGEVTASPLLGPTPTPAAAREARVDPLLITMTEDAARNLETCWNAADWDAVASLLTPHFLATAFGIASEEPAEQAAALAALDLGPLGIESMSPVVLWSDGRGAVDVRYLRGRGHPVQAVAARWFLVARQGLVTFDEEVLMPPPMLGDRVTVGFSIDADEQPLRWDGAFDGRLAVAPVTALYGTNRGWQTHAIHLSNAAGDVVGLLTLSSGSQGNLVLLDLPPGAYRLRDPTVAGTAETLIVSETV